MPISNQPSSYTEDRYRQELTLAVLKGDLSSILKHYDRNGQARYVTELVDTIIKHQQP